MFRCIGLAVLLLQAAAVSHAQPSAWVYLGQANVDGGRDHDNIVVRGGLYRAIQIRVERAPIEFGQVIVHYGNGAAEPIQIRSLIRPGGQTRVIDLPGERRVIRSVEFFYARARWAGRRPKVRLWGLQ